MSACASVSDEDISSSDHCQRGGSDGDDDEDDDDAAIGNKQRRTTTTTTTGGGFGKAKQVVLHQFTRAKKKLRRSRGKRPPLPSSSFSGNASTRSRLGKMMIRGDGTGTGIGCRFCFSSPKVLESLDGSPTNDPNDPKFTHAMLKTLIEKNDFYSKECNTHVDTVQDSSCSVPVPD